MDKITKDKINKLLDECVQISQRQTDLLNACLGYLRELICNDEELKRVLTQTIGMTNEEILDYGFNLDEKDSAFGIKYLSENFRFDIKGLSSEYPELAPFHGHTGIIKSLGCVGDGATFENNYWNVEMDNGTYLSCVSGHHLILI